ncbi:hypothetical protein NA57DRAFT_75788 [Rhizodiscina lignyota]|uniref:HMG box domain-containing protein n=1 Tax=Rhizodiscina lignyota TaxID=1504668 RepID=A0A9P4M5V8_9PEZI|nr:hypothetical protein NA57DRAFT_75788 [Rhizodiscina lignyota]
MTELNDRLERLGLSQYLTAFVAEGFDTWETVLDITESDLTSLNVKLGHRRKLQRAIAEWRGQSSEAPLPTARRRASVDGSYRSEDSGTEGKAPKAREPTGTVPPVSTKRKYRRHPKPDENAPERPASAYVIFSNQVRETLKGQDLSFADIAKIVGERWQVLSPESREACDKQASAAKEKYYQQLAEYKKTPEYSQYQVYLAEFKAKHANPTGGGEGKRSKLETETSVSTQSSASVFGGSDRTIGRRSDSGAGVPPGSHHRSVSTEVYEPYGATSIPSTSASPATRPYSSVNSPRLQGEYPPMATSPGTVPPAFRESLLTTGLPLHDLRERHQNPSPPGAPYLPPSGSPPTAYIPQHQNVHQPHPRRPPLDVLAPPPLTRADSSVPSVPSLAHTDTSASSVSGAGSRQSSYAGPHLTSLPPMDASKSHRILPQPVASASLQSPHDTPSPALPTRSALPQTTAPAPSDSRAGWSALLMATDLMRDADRRPPPEDKPP